jgi:hypothetical protein
LFRFLKHGHGDDRPNTPITCERSESGYRQDVNPGNLNIPYFRTGGAVRQNDGNPESNTGELTQEEYP